MSRPARTAALAGIRARLRSAGTPARARSEKAYLKSDLRFYGVAVPAIRTIAAEYVREWAIDRPGLRALAEAAFATREHELRSVAIAVLERRRRDLEGRDLAWLIDLVRASNTWAHVDWLAVAVIGDVISRTRSPARWLERWAKDESFWVRRTAVLAQLDDLKRERGDFALFTRIAGPLLEEREFFIRKAIGWVLREVSKKRPELTYSFLESHRDGVPRLTLQEGAKYLGRRERVALGLPPAPAWKRRDASSQRGSAVTRSPRAAGRVVHRPPIPRS